MFFLLVIFDTLFVGEYEDLTDRPKTFGCFGYLCFVIWITIACVRWADFYQWGYVEVIPQMKSLFVDDIGIVFGILLIFPLAIPFILAEGLDKGRFLNYFSELIDGVFDAFYLSFYIGFTSIQSHSQMEQEYQGQLAYLDMKAHLDWENWKRRDPQMLVDLWSKHLDNRQEAERIFNRLEPLGSRGSYKGLQY